MSEVLIKIIGLANGGYHPRIGQYVVAFDPTVGADGMVFLETTADPTRATRYADFAAAFELWRAVSPNRPVRSDGKPNRPMTIFTVEFVSVERSARLQSQ